MPSRPRSLLRLASTAAFTAGLLAGCGCEEPAPDDAGPPPRDAGEVQRVDASVIGPVGGGECAWTPGERPVVALPPSHENTYALELERWQIANDRGDPVETRQRINEALAWALGAGFDHVVIPPGNYLVGEVTNDAYAAGVEIPGSMTLELADGAVLEMAPNDRHNYCVISVDNHADVTIRGGEIRGDRDAHDYSSGTAHDEGHGICAWTSVHRVLIEGVELHELTGDGVLIVGRRASDTEPEVPSEDVTIRGCDIHHNRRQGVSIVGAHRVLVEDNHIHHIGGTAPQFGIDIEGAGRTDRDIHILRNRFHDNLGGDFVTSSGRNVWVEENTMVECQANAEGSYDPSLPCDSEGQTDGPIVLWQETDNVVLNNQIWMTNRSSNGLWGMINYPRERAAVRDNPIGNLIAGNTFHNCGLHSAWNQRQVIRGNVIHEGTLLAYLLECTRLTDNQINRVSGERFKLRNVAGQAEGNRVNREEGAPDSATEEVFFPMADDAPYRNSSPVFW